MSMINTAQNTLLPSFTPNSRKNLQNGKFSVVLSGIPVNPGYHMCCWYTGREGALIFHGQNQTAETKQGYSSCYYNWPLPLSSDAELGGKFRQRAQLHDEGWLTVIIGPQSGTAGPFSSECVWGNCCEWKLSMTIYPWQIDIKNERTGQEPHTPLQWRE